MHGICNYGSLITNYFEEFSLPNHEIDVHYGDAADRSGQGKKSFTSLFSDPNVNFIPCKRA
jgi:hypothetical protein